MVTGALIEVTLKILASSLCQAKTRIRPLFSEARVAASADSYLDGLLGDERRKTRSGGCAPRRRAMQEWRQQAILTAGGGIRTPCATMTEVCYTTDPSVLA